MIRVRVRRHLVFLDEFAQTGIGSYIVIGFQSGMACISETIACARFGEQMKCKFAGFCKDVPCISLVVNLCLGVRYLNLCEWSIAAKKVPLDHSPAKFATIHIQSTSGDTLWVISVQPHVTSVRIQRFLHMTREIISLVHNHSYTVRRKPGQQQSSQDLRTFRITFASELNQPNSSTNCSISAPSPDLCRCTH